MKPQSRGGPAYLQQRDYSGPTHPVQGVALNRQIEKGAQFAQRALREQGASGYAPVEPSSAGTNAIMARCSG